MDKKRFKIYSVILNIISAITFMMLLIYPFCVREIKGSDSLLDTCVLSTLGIFIYLLMSFVLHACKLGNIPVQITSEHKERIYKDANAMLIVLRAEIMLCFGYVLNAILVGSSGNIYLLIFAIMLAYTCIHYFHKMKQHA